MSRVLYYVLMLMLVTPKPTTIAQEKPFRPVADVDSFRKQFKIESSKVQSITSDFKQQKQLLALTETITSTGKFYFKRSDKVRIDYQKPFVYLMIMNGDKIFVKDDQKENTINVRSNKLFQQVNTIIVDCIQGTILESKDFSTKIFENENFFRLEMTPSSKLLKDFFQTIVLIVDRKDYSVDSIQMNEPSGDKTIMSFFNKKLNLPVTDEVFKL